MIHQPRYNMFDRWVEDGLLNVLEEKGIGSIAFSPLAQGVLTKKYLKGRLNKLAGNRGQSLAQMAIAWLLKDQRISTVLVGVSRTEQLLDNLEALKNINFSGAELKEIESILG